MSYLLIAVLGFAALRFWIAFFNWASRPYLQAATYRITDHPVKLSVLIPARNEADKIGPVVQAVLRSEGVALELLVLDDHSDDNTSAQVLRAIEGDARARLLQGRDLPVGWLGKSWACHQLAAAATGDWLVFIDADVLLQPKALAYALHQAEKRKLDGLSVFPFQEMKTKGEQLTVPLMHQLLLSLLPLWFIRWFKFSSLAAANGQFILLRAADYRVHHWHERVKAEIVEDIAIFRAFKKAGKKVMTFTDPAGFIRCRMYGGLREGINGFSKNLLSGFGNSVFALFSYLFLTLYSWPLLWWLGARFEFIGLLLVVVAVRVYVSLAAGQRPWRNILLHLPQQFIFHWIAWKSVYLRLSGRYEWKGRKLR